jgi:hypothetical protein
MCGKDDWSVYEPVGLPPLGIPPFEGAVLPVCPISCKTCGYTVMLSLVDVGIIEPRSSDTGDTDAEAES